MIIKKTNTVLNKLKTYEFSVFSTRGRAVAALFGGSLCVGSLVLASNTVALSWTKSLFLVERKGKVVIPTAHLQTLGKAAATDLKLLNFDKANVFSSDSEVVTTFGSLTSPFGALIGIPTYLNANSSEEVIIDETLYRPMTDNEKEMLAELKENSVFSDSAKLYVMSEGLATVRDSDHYVVPAIVTSVCFFGSFLGAAIIVKYYNLNKIPFYFRVPTYALSIILWSWIAFGLIDQYFEYLFSRMLTDFSERCIDGGIEFYEKSLKRHEINQNLFGYYLFNLGTKYLTFCLTRRLSVLRRRKEESL